LQSSLMSKTYLKSDHFIGGGSTTCWTRRLRLARELRTARSPTSALSTLSHCLTSDQGCLQAGASNIGTTDTFRSWTGGLSDPPSRHPGLSL